MALKRPYAQRRLFHEIRKTYHPTNITSKPGAEEIIVFNPATGDAICGVASTSTDDVKSTIHNAQRTFESGIWSKSPALLRSKVLSKLARKLEEGIPDLIKIETMQTGRTIREMKAQLERLPEWLDYFAALLRTHQSFVAPTQGKLLNYVERVPLGVVAQITVYVSRLSLSAYKQHSLFEDSLSTIHYSSQLRK